MKSEVRRRQRQVGVRLTESEYTTIQRAANESRLSVPTYMRRVVLVTTGMRKIGEIGFDKNCE